MKSVSFLARDDMALLQNPRGLDGDSPTRPCHKLHRHLFPLQLPQIPWVLPDHMVHTAKLFVLQPGPAAESRSNQAALGASLGQMKNLPISAGDLGWIPGLGGSHMLWSN